ncbi:hypothetical protein INE74_00414 [Bacteroides ovatus CL03T12C18]|nr:hypothetical protein [Bacteroides ovatus CL03T12C18]
MGKDDDAGFMNRPEASQSFELQINTLLKMIFMGSFVVMPPEVKSGDLPGVAIKLIYSPSLEKAMIDCKEFDESIDKMKRLFPARIWNRKRPTYQIPQFENFFVGSSIRPPKCSRIGIELGTISQCRYFIERNRLGRIRLWEKTMNGIVSCVNIRNSNKLTCYIN